LDDVRVSGFLVLFIGVAALIFTFVMAYQFLTGVIDVPSSEDLMRTFGDALGTPDIVRCKGALPRHHGMSGLNTSKTTQ